MTRRATFAVLAGLAAMFAAAPALADGEIVGLIKPADNAKLERFEATRAEALRQARAGGSAEDVAVLDALTSARDKLFGDFDFSGRWKCRTIKTGKLLPIVIYGWFDCRVDDTDIGGVLRKLTGSQRTTGRFFDDGDTRMIYLGALHLNDEPAKPYGTGPETNQVGYAFLNANGGWRIEFPEPYFESLMDILEFQPVK